MTIRKRLLRMAMAAFKLVVRMIHAAGLHGVLAAAWVPLVKEIHADGSRTKPRTPAVGTISILILDDGRLRGDDRILAGIGDFRCLHLSSILRRFLLAAFVREPTAEEWANPPSGKSLRYDFADPEPESEVGQGREAYRAFLRRFLPRFYDRFGIRAVINSDDRYRKDRDITIVSSELGYPHICLYREAMAYLLPFNYEDARDRHAAFGRFGGDMILVQNEVVRRMFLESGYVDPDKLRISGCTRMDGLLEVIRNGDFQTNDRRRVVFFTMNSNTDRRNGVKFDLMPVSLEVVSSLAELAMERPEIDVVVKLKDLHFKGPKGGQLPVLQDEVRRVAGDLESVPNLSFSTDRAGAQKLILSSDVVCAMQSTTVLEAAVAGKPVIVPCFDWIREEPDAHDFIIYMDDLHLFDVPADGRELKQMILRRLENKTVPEDILARRRALFERYVGPVTGGSTRIVADTIKQLVAETGGAERSMGGRQ